VELVVAEVGASADEDQIYRLTFDGSVQDEHGMVAMGGQAEAVAGRLKEGYRDGMALTEALRVGVNALTEPGGEAPPTSQLEVAVLDRNRPHRKFVRLVGARLERLLAEAAPAPAEPAQEKPKSEEATESKKPKGSGSDAPTAPEGDIDTGSGD
jgi:proteasome alpha subunit